MAGVARAQAYQHLLTIDCLSFAFRLTRRVAVCNVVSSYTRSRLLCEEYQIRELRGIDP